WAATAPPTRAPSTCCCPERPTRWRAWSFDDARPAPPPASRPGIEAARAAIASHGAPALICPPNMAENTARAAEPASPPPALDFERPVIDLERKIEELVRVSGDAPELRMQIELLGARARELQQEIFAELTPWQKVQLSRHPARPYTLDYVERLFEGFIEL